MPTILTPSAIGKDLHGLDVAWSSSATFAFVPDKVAEMRLDIAATLESLPASLSTDHYALLTSGTTGEPKLVFGSRDRSRRLTRVLNDVQASDSVSETVVLLPLTYCYSFVNQYLWARTHKKRLVLTDGLSRPEELAKTLADAEDSMICLIGAQVPLLVKYFGGREFPGVVRVHFAGGRFPVERLGEVSALFPNAKIFNNYGCAEAMPRLTVRLSDEGGAASHVGWPIPGVELSTSDGDELLFRSPFGAVGQADQNGFQSIRPDDWVPTGDLGKLCDDGHVEILARSSEVFKRYGEKISIPIILESLATVWHGNLGVYREQDPAGEEGYVLVVSPHPEKSTIREFLSALRASHNRTHWPLRIESTDKLPTLSNGKIDHKALESSTNLQQHWRQRI